MVNDFLSKRTIILIAVPIFCLYLSGCNKGVTLKINDQDVLAFGSQDSCNFITTNILANTLRVSWKSDVPVKFIITNSIPPEFDTEINSAVAKWNTLMGRNLMSAYRDTGFKNLPGSDRVNGIYWSTSWEFDLAAEQARTAVRWDISKLIDTDIRINAKNFTFYKTGDVPAGKVHLESLMVHELGHGLGLTHIADLASVMQVQLKAETVRSDPGSIDLTSLKCEY